MDLSKFSGVALAVAFAFQAWGIGHCADTAPGSAASKDGTSRYMTWSPLTSDANGTATRLRVSVGLYGVPTEIRLALYSRTGSKLIEATKIVTSAGYQELVVPPVRVAMGEVYYLGAQAASAELYKRLTDSECHQA